MKKMNKLTAHQNPSPIDPDDQPVKVPDIEPDQPVPVTPDHVPPQPIDPPGPPIQEPPGIPGTPIRTKPLSSSTGCTVSQP